MAAVPEAPSASPRRSRIGFMDTARGIALVAMATYHFGWDLEFFGYLDPGTTSHGLWKIYARGIAGSFLFLAGMSLVLGHTPAIRWQAFWRRFLMIAGAAGLITAATAYAMPQGMIFFGILHGIAAASLIGLAFLRLPAAVTIIVALAALVAPWYLRSPFFDTPWLWWVGLSETLPRSNDYVPLLPWLGPFLLGMAAMRLAIGGKWMERLATGPSSNLLARAGRHSLAVYLIHQPVLIALVYGLSLVLPPPPPDPVADYRRSCNQACVQNQDATMCTRFCDCTLDKLMEQELFTPLQSGAIRADQDERIQAIAQQCTVAAQ